MCRHRSRSHERGCSWCLVFTHHHWEPWGFIFLSLNHFIGLRFWCGWWPRTVWRVKETHNILIVLGDGETQWGRLIKKHKYAGALLCLNPIIMARNKLLGFIASQTSSQDHLFRGKINSCEVKDCMQLWYCNYFSVCCTHQEKHEIFMGSKACSLATIPKHMIDILWVCTCVLTCLWV